MYSTKTGRKAGDQRLAKLRVLRRGHGLQVGALEQGTLRCQSGQHDQVPTTCH